MSATTCARCGHANNWHSIVDPKSRCMGFAIGTSRLGAIDCTCPAYQAPEVTPSAVAADDPADVKAGDTISLTTTIKVREVSSRFILGVTPEKGTELTYSMRDIGENGRTVRLLERPTPPEPPVGSVVVFRTSDNYLDAWKRWDDHLGWLHAGNSTPRQPGVVPQGWTWAELIEPRAALERTVIEP